MRLGIDHEDRHGVTDDYRNAVRSKTGVGIGMGLVIGVRIGTHVKFFYMTLGTPWETTTQHIK